MKQCFFCNNGVKEVDYKDTESLKKFLNPHARIVNKRTSGLCALHQRGLARAIKRARSLALLPYTTR